MSEQAEKCCVCGAKATMLVMEKKEATSMVKASTVLCTMCDGTGYFDQGEVSGRCATCKGTGERRAASEAKGGVQP